MDMHLRYSVGDVVVCRWSHFYVDIVDKKLVIEKIVNHPAYGNNMAACVGLDGIWYTLYPHEIDKVE